MYALIAMALALGLLVVLMHRGVKLGRSMIIAAIALAVMLKVTPGVLLDAAVAEWHGKPLSQTTAYLWVTLTALVILVNVLGIAMKEAGVSQPLAEAMQGLFRSRRVALAAIPMMMGLLPTPGGIMLSAPMVRDLGDQLGVERSRAASINFLFRHQWETVWPLFPSVPLIQGMFGISAFALVSHNIAITVAGLLGGVIFLLATAVPKDHEKKVSRGRFKEDLKGLVRAIWPIVVVAGLYAGIDLPPAIGLLLALVAFLAFNRVPVGKWAGIFKSGFELDFALLIMGALLFKLNLQAGGAIESVVQFLKDVEAPMHVVIFILPFIVAVLTGVTVATVAMTFPLLQGFIGMGDEARIGLETLAFSGVICGLLVTPVHLCIALSASYFECSLMKVVLRLLAPAAFVAGAGVLMARLAG